MVPIEFRGGSLACVFVIASSFTSHARARPALASYDAQPILASVRPAVLAELHARQRDRSLEELPLYDLELDAQPDSGSFALTETLYFANQGAQPLPDLLLRIDANAGRTAEQSLVRLVSTKCLERVCSVRRISPGTLDVVFARPLQAHEGVRVVMQLAGSAEKLDESRTTLLGQGLEGLSALGSRAASSYGLFALGDGIFSLANFYAVLAPRVGNRWQMPDDSGLGDRGSDELGNVRVTLSAPADYVVAHVGSPVATVTTLNADGPGRHRRQSKIVAGLVRDFTLVMARGFARASRTVSGVEVNSYFREPERVAGEQVLDVACFALRDFEQRFGAYPYARLDVAEAPLVGGAGGVEFSGLATVGSAFYKELGAGALSGALGALGQQLSGLSGDMTRSMREFVTAHEVAHQWWHVLVGSDSRLYPFADEGLAQYSTLLYFEDRYGRERAAQEAEQNLKLPFQMMRMAGEPDAAVERPVASFASPVAYGGLVYGKGPFFYREARRILGDEVFFSRLRQYRDQFAFRTAPGRAVIEALARSQRGPIQDLARHWLEQAHGDEDLGKFALGDLLRGAPGTANSAGVELPAQLRQLLDIEGP